jgi:hypothetical protein
MFVSKINESSQVVAARRRVWRQHYGPIAQPSRPPKRPMACAILDVLPPLRCQAGHDRQEAVALIESRREARGRFRSSSRFRTYLAGRASARVADAGSRLDVPVTAQTQQSSEKPRHSDGGACLCGVILCDPEVSRRRRTQYQPRGAGQRTPNQLPSVQACLRAGGRPLRPLRYSQSPDSPRCCIDAVEPAFADDTEASGLRQIGESWAPIGWSWR